jgi:hypothetical protein
VSERWNGRRGDDDALARIDELAVKTTDILAPAGYPGTTALGWAAFVEGCVEDARRGGEAAALAVANLEAAYRQAVRNGGAP